MRKSVIITAGGTGERMGASIPKQFILLNNKPVIFHTIERFFKYDNEIEIIISLKKELFKLWYEMVEAHDFSINYKLVEGGKTRYHSVKNALNIIPENSLVAVHDSVRPLTTLKIINDTFEKASEVGAAIPVINLKDSIREISDKSNRSVERSSYRLVQTPQVFKSQLLKNAYSLEFNNKITDDAGLVEKAGNIVYLVEGDYRNIKITEQYDLQIAELFLSTL